MSAQRTPSSFLKRLFSFWIGVILLTLLVIVWALASLSPKAPGRADTSKTTAASASAPSPAETQKEAPLPPATVPGFDPETAEYILTAFSPEGIHHITDAEPVFTLLSPGNFLTAQLIRRGAGPEPLSDKDGVTLRYTIDPPHDKSLAPETASGIFTFDAQGKAFVCGPIPLLPYYEQDGKTRFAPYPTASVEARDAKGQLLAQTRVVLPVSSETGCRNCHTGPWKVDGKAGISKTTALDILKTHDRRNKTKLQEKAAKGTPVNCKSCHGGPGKEMELSAAIHGFHAEMALKGAEACGKCHPSAEKGYTHFFRDFHSLWGLDCTRCHGAMEDHALALLKAEAESGNKTAVKRMERIRPIQVAKIADIVPRKAGVQLPQCAGCHNFKDKPDAGTASAFNAWTKTPDERFTLAKENTGALRCPSCHGAPHALYASDNPVGDGRDNIQPRQYQKLAAPLGKDNNCAVCHTMDMEPFIHHDLPANGQ